jgi:anti-sigma regulatory factor (Ser/Thr protein kinase)
VVVAAHELAANAVRHGAGLGRLRLGADGGVLTCQVSDEAPAAADANHRHYAAMLGPWSAKHGHGLWVMEQVADQFKIERGRAGTTAIAAFMLADST